MRPTTGRTPSHSRHAGVILVSALVGAMAGLAGFMTGRGARLSPFPWLAVAGIAGVLAAIAVHELGHVVGGLTQRFTFRWMTVGPLRVSLERGRLRFSVNRVGILWGGTAVLQPLDDRDLLRRMCWIAAGGPLASLALAAVAWVAAQGAGREAWLMTCLASFLIAVVTLVPSQMNGLRSDGGRLLDLLRDGPARQRECRLLAILVAMNDGQRPASWNADTMRAILEEPAGYHLEIPSLLSAYLWCLDRDAIDEAEAVLERALVATTTHAPVFRAAVLLEAAWWHAVMRDNLALAERELAEAGSAMVLGESTRLRAHAAVLSRQGAHADARRAMDAALAALATENMGGAAPLLQRMTRESVG